MEIAVTLSSAFCIKTTVTHYLGKTVFLSCGVCHSLHIYSAVEGVLTSVSLRSRTLVIESRDCIASPENYRIVVTSTDTPSTELVNISFSPTIEHDVGDVVRPNTQYTIRVQIVEKSSNTTTDEMTTTVMWLMSSPTSSTDQITPPSIKSGFTPFMGGKIIVTYIYYRCDGWCDR